MSAKSLIYTKDSNLSAIFVKTNYIIGINRLLNDQSNNMNENIIFFISFYPMLTISCYDNALISKNACYKYFGFKYTATTSSTSSPWWHQD